MLFVLMNDQLHTNPFIVTQTLQTSQDMDGEMNVVYKTGLHKLHKHRHLLVQLKFIFYNHRCQVVQEKITPVGAHIGELTPLLILLEHCHNCLFLSLIM